MTRYLIFVYTENYQKGGANDFYGGFDDLEKALEVCKEQNKQPELECHIFDINTRSIITNRE